MNTITRLFIWPILAAPIVYLAIVWNNLPETVPLHFNFKGEPDRYGSRSELIVAIGVMIGLALLIYLLLPLAYKIDPKQSAAGNKIRLQRIAFAVSTLLSLVTCVIIHSVQNQTFHFDMRIVLGGVGLLYCFIGNYIHTIKPNYFAGFRLPWTLENEENWKKTHILGGKFFFGGGLLIFLAALLLDKSPLFIVFISLTAVMVIVPCIYSYVLYKKQAASKN